MDTNTKKITAEQIVDYITEEYLTARKAITVREIAKGLECSEAKVRTQLNDIHFKTRKLSRQTGERPTFSKDYPMFSHGSCRVTLWEPSKDYLAEMINAMRANPEGESND